MRDYDVTLTVTATVTVTVRAESDVDACERAVAHVAPDVDVHDWTFDPATIAPTMVTQ